MPTHKTQIAGARYRPGALAYCKDLGLGEKLALIRDPENPHDRNAVKVFHGAQWLGFVPRGLAPDVCRLMAEGRLESAEYTGHERMQIHYREDAA